MSESPVIHNVDNISFKLKKLHNFDWLCSLGKVFCVFDQQDSGNISFGLEKNGQRKFIKFAGAKTLNYSGDPQEAVLRLKQSILRYEELTHQHLVRLIDHFDIEQGYAVVFDWFEGECLHPHWAFPPPAKYIHPNSPYFRFKQLPVELRLTSMDLILNFHVYVESKNYVAVDFYDGSILYDFTNHITKICDIDYYQKKPFVNTMGRLWGSSRFMSPEEFELGAIIDEKTNVFNLGSMAFSLLGGELDHSYSKWDVGRELYEVVIKAVEKDRSKRYTSVEEFYSAWKMAIEKVL
ncbi:serine/threonine protein kinase [Bacillus sp. RG28]|uniref:Serine/threonine protein kinase n=1 Tax=Gottfriedia endophytica TaxID=2820819 RepID=A0A940NR64_9BACI|nr:serine/threonine protein kinase [Gottfriedia endophytica]MBP0725467.1 serine/threonine protein kinase [Gottfriedia endophytica]